MSLACVCGVYVVLSKMCSFSVFSLASAEDLWRCLGEASGQPVDEVMSTWTKQMGYPVLDVQRRQVCGGVVS